MIKNSMFGKCILLNCIILTCYKLTFYSMGTFCFDCSTSFLDSSSSDNGSTFPSGDLLVNKIGM